MIPREDPSGLRPVLLPLLRLPCSAAIPAAPAFPVSIWHKVCTSSSITPRHVSSLANKPVSEPARRSYARPNRHPSSPPVGATVLPAALLRHSCASPRLLPVPPPTPISAVLPIQGQDQPTVRWLAGCDSTFRVASLEHQEIPLFG